MGIHFTASRGVLEDNKHVFTSNNNYYATQARLGTVLVTNTVRRCRELLCAKHEGHTEVG